MNDKQFELFYGVVEDINDPLENGRIRVRIIGKHSEETVANDTTGKGIPSEDLPWSLPILPTTAGGVHGFKGHCGLLPGAWIVGVSMDGEEMNELLILGSIPGIPQEKNKNPSTPPIAFHGIDGKWPAEEFIGEPDVPRLARGSDKGKDERFKPSHIRKRARVKKGIPTAGGGSWDQKPDGFKAKYPTNQVFLTPKGHVLEFDDTDGGERISLTHGKTTTHIDILDDGSMQTKVESDKYDITIKDNKQFVGGELCITVNGNTRFLCEKSAYIEAKENVEVKAGKDAKVKAKNVDVEASSSASVKGQNVKVEASGKAEVKGSNVDVSASGQLNLSGGGGVVISGPTITHKGKVIP